MLEHFPASLHFRFPIVGLDSLYARLAAVVRGKGAIYLQERRLVFRLGLRKLRASIPVGEFCNYLAARYPVSFVNIYLADDALELRLQACRMYGSYYRISLDAQRPRNGGQKDRQGNSSYPEEGTPLFFQCHEFPFTRKYRLQHGNEGHFLIHLRIA